MKIESRVEALEHELKILKNEIQNTLLEIREQVLNHYYPELRAEETLQPAGRPVTSPRTASTPKINEIRGSKNSQATGSERNGERSNARSSFPEQPKAQVQPFSDFFIEEEETAIDDADEWPGKQRNASKRFPIQTIRETQQDEFAGDEFADDELDAHEYARGDHGYTDDYSDDETDGSNAPEMPSRTTAAPKLREVQYQQLKQAGATPQPKSKTSGSPAPRPVRRPFAALAAWVGESVAKVGKERAVQVVETYAVSGGNLANDTKSSLLQLIALASDVEPAAPVTNQEMLGLMVELDHLLSE